jgi:transcriptional regulator with XRE-family HTH domain
MAHQFGEKLRYLRLQRGLTQTELAHQLQLSSHSHVNNLEAGRRAPSLTVVLQVAAIFGVTTDYLLRDRATGAALQAEPRSLPSGSPATLFRQKLRHLRKQRKLTQTELSARLALRTQAHISLLESGRSEPSLEFVLQLADFFAVPTDYLLQDSIPVEGGKA